MSENELAKKFNVSRLTARKAIENLVNEGLLVRVQGIGTFVSDIEKENKKKNKYIGILIKNRFDTRGWSMISGIEKTLKQFNYKALILDLKTDSPQQISRKIHSLLSQNVEGLIITPTHNLSNSKVFEKLVKQNFPIIFVDRNIEGLDISTVESSNYHGGKILGEHLKNVHKIRNVLFVTEETMDLTSVKERLEGFKKGLGSGKVDVLILEKNRENRRKLLSTLKKKNCEAIFFCHDLLAVYGISILLREGYKIPEDIKIVSFDNNQVSKYILPNLTTVEQNFEILGENVAMMIIKLINGEKIPKIKHIPVHLIIRESCGCNL